MFSSLFDAIPGYYLTSLLAACNRFSPSVFLLKSGQTLHIPKGCVHAFRKLSRNKLSEDDCHYKLRKTYLEGLSEKEEDVCISFAWDWVRLGDSSHSINTELDFLFQVLKDNQKARLGPSAPIGRSVLRMANALCKEPTEVKCDLLAHGELALGIVPALQLLLKSQDKIFVGGTGMAIFEDKLSVFKGKDSTKGCSFCDVCSTELINFFWCRTGSQIDEVEETLIPAKLCDSCFKNFGSVETKFELRHTFSDINQLQKLVNDVKTRGGSLF